MEVDQTYTEEGILYHRVTSLESLRTIKDDPEEAGEEDRGRRWNCGKDLEGGQGSS